MTMQKLKLVAAVLAAGVGAAVAGGVALRAQPGDPPPTPAAPNAPRGLPEKPIVAAGAPAEGPPPPKEQKEGPAKKVKELQKERIATLKELADVTAGLFKNARASYEEALEARLLLLRAELDAAEKASERVVLYKQSLDALREYEERARAQAQSGRGSSAAVLKIKARRLEVEIQWEQAKEAGPGK